MATDAGDFGSFATSVPRAQAPRAQTPAAPRASQPVPPRNYDSLFDLYRGDIPLEYLRALAIVSGGGDFRPTQSTSDTAGLFAISTSLVDAYNRQFGTTYRPTDLGDVIINTKIAVWLINNVTKYYSLHYPRGLANNWRNSDYVSLVTLGFKVGHSENGGLGDALKVIEAQYPDRMNLEVVAQVAQQKGLPSYIYSQTWIDFAKHVTNLYAGSPHTSAPAAAPVPQVSRQSGGRGIGGAGIAIVAAIPLLALAFSGKKK